MRAEPKTDHRIHVEFAHFSNIEFFELFEKFAVRNADSLGMNEQELTMILDYWTNKLRVRPFHIVGANYLLGHQRGQRV